MTMFVHKLIVSLIKILQIRILEISDSKGLLHKDTRAEGYRHTGNLSLNTTEVISSCSTALNKLLSDYCMDFPTAPTLKFLCWKD